MSFKKITIALTALTAAFTLVGCSGNEEKAVVKAQAPVLVTVASPDGAAATGWIEASGQVEAAHSVNISTRAMGYITQMPVKVGDHVKAGQLLFAVNSADIHAKRAQTDAMIAQADAALNNAKKDYDRFTTLYKQQSASAKELDQVTLQYQSAKAAAEAARQMKNEVSANLSYTRVTAPFTGIVTQKMMDAGSMATPGMPVLTIEQAGSLQVSASVAENQIGSLKVGDPAVLKIASAEKTIEGKVIQLNPSSQFSGGQYIVKISIPADTKQLYAGMFVHVQFPVKAAPAAVSGESGAVMIPVKAIINRDQLTGVYTISAQNTALLRWVRLGKTTGDQVEVLSGLAKNEQYILSAEGRLYNGAPVKIK
ncbi:MAG: efflux RND transporter periplasmic adaptor subunit [Sphingobacteriia bacterium]|nr:efflux RND transporter periplasmic adaptor subunit [Sphingobacteriia bacterium]